METDKALYRTQTENSTGQGEILVAALYHFFGFAEYAHWRERLLGFMRERGIKGTLLLASEGINGTVSGTEQEVRALLALLRGIPGLERLEHKESWAGAQPFGRALVKVKKEIVTFGAALKPGQRRGTEVSPQEWNALIKQEDVTLLDARNAYEWHIGTFVGALTPEIRSFTQLKRYVEEKLDTARNRRIATFCTGGIRCEKFSAWLLERGFEEVYQLRGGILKYLEEVPEGESAWRGECFVFDGRVAVGHGLEASGEARICSACGRALKADEACCA